MGEMSCLQTIKNVDKRGTYVSDVLFANNEARG